MGFFSELAEVVAVAAVSSVVESVTEKSQNRLYDEKREELLENYGAIVNHATRNGMVDELFAFFVISIQIAISCAASDGHISSEERSDIDELVHTVMSIVPENERISFQAEINNFYKQPTQITELVMPAYSIADMFGLPNVDVFTNLIETIIYADGVVDSKEEIFYKTWIEKTKVIEQLLNK